jgi:hypothetical protein
MPRYYNWEGPSGIRCLAPYLIPRRSQSGRIRCVVLARTLHSGASIEVDTFH